MTPEEDQRAQIRAMIAEANHLAAAHEITLEMRDQLSILQGYLSKVEHRHIP